MDGYFFYKHVISLFTTKYEDVDTLPRPHYILNVTDNFTIQDVTNPDVRADLDREGWGIISYTWGRWQDKNSKDTSPNAPRFDAHIPANLRWCIPKMDMGKDGSFTMDEVRAVIQSLNMKYVWWDWACIPQYWNSNADDPQRPGHKIGYVDPSLKTIGTEEVAKQSVIYTKAKKSIIWLHNTVWTPPNDANRSAVQELLEFQLPKPPPNPQPVIEPPQKPTYFTTVPAYLKLITECMQREYWFTSLWTFQEGILLNSDNTVDPRDGTVFATRNYDQFAQLVDKNGTTLDSGVTYTVMEGNVQVTKTRDFFRNCATMIDITGPVTLAFCGLTEILSSLQAEGEPKDPTEAQWWQDSIAAIPDWMRALEESGMSGFVADSPLNTIEAGKARGDPKFIREEDYCVNAIIGALQVTLPTGIDSKDIPRLQTGLLSSLVDRYGWRMLLFTKPTRSLGRVNAHQGIFGGDGKWASTILGLQWDFTSLGAYISTTLGSIVAPGPSPEPVTKPLKWTDSELPVGGEPQRRINLPKLQHCRSYHPSPVNVDAIVVVGPDPANLSAWDIQQPYGCFCYNFPPGINAPQSDGWSDCRFYASEDYAQMGVRKQSRCVVQQIQFKDASATFGKEPFVLLPMENVSITSDAEPLAIIRCAVLQGFCLGMGNEKGSAAAVFAGIGDFHFPPLTAEIPVQTVVNPVAQEPWAIWMY